MSVYRVEPDDLMAAFGLGDLVAACDPVVGQLVERFDLAGKTLMSVGAGCAHEEAALLRHGMRRALLFDIDPESSIEPTLRRLHRPDRTQAPFVYVVADFLAAPPPQEDLEGIDVLYFSGFTPDELRRGEISERHRRSARPHPSADQHADPHWPAATSPVHDVVPRAIDRYLEDGGLFVLQSYTAGVDVLRNPGYVSQWRDVLGRHRVALIEVYYFRAAPGVTLWIGMKQAGGVALPDLTARPPLTRFHARAQLEDCSIARL